MILIKMSAPSWEKAANTLEELEEMLKAEVCDSCMVTKSKFAPTGDPISDMLDRAHSLDDNWMDNPITDRIHILLDTACGCEYSVEGIGNGDEQDTA